MKKVCIFDCDGTLLNTLGSFAYCGNRALEELGYEKIEEKEYRYMVGDGPIELIRRVLRRAGDETCSNFDRMAETYFKYFRRYCGLGVVPYEGMTDALEKLKKEGVLLAVLSNKPHEQNVEVIQKIFGKDLFSVILGQKEGMRKKPDPQGVMQIMKELGAKPEECYYFGDTDTDMKTGKAAGLYTVGVLWGFRTRQELEENQADCILEDPSQIPGLVLS